MALALDPSNEVKQCDGGSENGQQGGEPVEKTLRQHRNNYSSKQKQYNNFPNGDNSRSHRYFAAEKFGFGRWLVGVPQPWDTRGLHRLHHTVDSSLAGGAQHMRYVSTLSSE